MCGISTAVDACRNEGLFEGKVDYVLSACLITGIALLVIGACIQGGIIPLFRGATYYLFGCGGGLFGVCVLSLCFRGYQSA